MKMTNCHSLRDIFLEIFITFFTDKSIFKYRYSCACNTFGLVYHEITHIETNLYSKGTKIVDLKLNVVKHCRSILMFETYN